MQRINVDLSKLSTQFHRDTDSNRVETGALQFNEDWPGVFIRGDNAAFYAMQLRHLIRYVEQNADHIDFYALNTAKNLVDLLNSCVIVRELEDNDTEVGC